MKYLISAFLFSCIVGWGPFSFVSEGKKVSGIIIAGQFDKRLEYALSMVPDTRMFIYEVDFRLREI